VKIETDTAYYRDPDSGDFVAVTGPAWEGFFEARIPVLCGVLIPGCEGVVSGDYLRRCERVEAEAVPAEWLELLAPVEAGEL
jgi:hypothetical protein